MKKKFFAILLLLIIPALLSFFRLKLEKAYYSSDPEYVYMMNGINVCLFQLPYYSDHPGVPLTFFNATFLYPIYWLSGHHDGLVNDFFINPLYYELRLQLILFIIVMIFSFIGGYVLWKETKSIMLAMLLQGIPFYYFISAEFVAVRMMPETIFPIIFLAFMIIVVRIINHPENRKTLLLLPVLSGFALSLKIIIFPLLLIPALLYGRTFKTLFKYCVLTSLSFIIFCLPIIKQFPHMGYWFLKLFVFSGIYGHGATSIIEPAKYAANLKYIITSNELLCIGLFFAIIFAIILPFLRKKYPGFLPGEITRLFYIVFAAALLDLLIVAKSFDPGKEYYFITYSVLIFASVTFILIGVGKKLSALYRIVGVFILLIVVLLTNLNKYKENIKGYKLCRQEYLESENFINKQGNCLFIYQNAYSLNKMNSLIFGHAYTKIHLERLQNLYPNALFFDVIPGKFSFWTKQINITPILFSRKTFIVDSELSQESILKLNKLGISPIEVFRNRTKAIYQIQYDTRVMDENTKKKYSTYIYSIQSNQKWMNDISAMSLKKKVVVDSLVKLGALWFLQ